jgi:D-alanyl-D-alanine endopeptidase (penicillin-binding protein 7)
MPTPSVPPIARRALFSLGTALAAAAALLYFSGVAAEHPAAGTSQTGSALQPQPSPAAQIVRYGHSERLQLQSQIALVLDEREGVLLLARDIDTPRPIASLTKLMTALVVLESDLPLEAPIVITTADLDRLKGSRSRLRVGSILTRDDLLRAALAASDNRAASALARSWPGGREAFIVAMNGKARALGMTSTHFADASGLDRHNVSTARDLARLLVAAGNHPRLPTYSTRSEVWVTDLASGHPVAWNNTNRLVRSDGWEIDLSKTGYTAEAGNCLVMRATIGQRPVSIVLLNSWGRLSKYGDAGRIRDWLLEAERKIPQTGLGA